jgi:hypothetical protein
MGELGNQMVMHACVFVCLLLTIYVSCHAPDDLSAA